MYLLVVLLYVLIASGRLICACGYRLSCVYISYRSSCSTSLSPIMTPPVSGTYSDSVWLLPGCRAVVCLLGAGALQSVLLGMPSTPVGEVFTVGVATLSRKSCFSTYATIHSPGKSRFTPLYRCRLVFMVSPHSHFIARRSPCTTLVHFDELRVACWVKLSLSPSVISRYMYSRTLLFRCRPILIHGGRLLLNFPFSSIITDSRLFQSVLPAPSVCPSLRNIRFPLYIYPSIAFYRYHKKTFAQATVWTSSSSICFSSTDITEYT